MRITVFTYAEKLPLNSEAIENVTAAQPSPEPSCHACGGPIEIGKPVAIYHAECDRSESHAMRRISERGVTSIHETQNSLIFISDLRATKVFDKKDVDRVYITELR